MAANDSKEDVCMDAKLLTLSPPVWVAAYYFVHWTVVTVISAVVQIIVGRLPIRVCVVVFVIERGRATNPDHTSAEKMS
jgi:hypothetical protein